MCRWIVVSTLLLLSVAAFAAPEQDTIILENHPRAYAYSYGFGDDDSTGAYLGVDITDIAPERMSTLKLKVEQGVEVTLVDQDAPAGKAGLKEHDVILTMNGTAVESGAQLRRMIRETPPGRVVSLGVSRDGQPLTIKVPLGDRRKNVAFAHSGGKDFKFEMPAMPAIPPIPDIDVPVSVVVAHSSLRSGLMVENITPQLGEFFGVKNGKGVLVRSVDKGSRAEKAGFRAGDVIVKVNDQAVQDTSDFTHALRTHSGANTNVVVIRDKREQNISLPLPQRKDSGAVIEESFDQPDLDADTFVDLSEVETQIAQMKPQIQLAMRMAQDEAEKARPAIEKAMREAQQEIREYHIDMDQAVNESQKAAAQIEKEWCTQQRQIQQEVRKAQREVQREMQKQRKEMLEQNRRQMERWQHEFSGDWLEI